MDGGRHLTQWENFRCLVTGGTRGIGYAVAQQLVDRGAHVAILGRDEVRVEKAVETLSQGAPGLAMGVVGVIDGQESTAQTLVENAVQGLGGPLDGLVNCAGGATVGHALDIPWNTWHQDLAVKFWGYFAMIRAAVPQLRSPGGVIVNILGVAGKDPNPRLAPGTAINGALRGLTKILADDLAPRRIRVAAVNPGATDTDLLREMARGYAQLNGTTVDQAERTLRSSGPLGRLPVAEDIAHAVVFLMSEEAALVTGTSLDIDGGVHRGPA